MRAGGSCGNSHLSHRSPPLHLLEGQRRLLIGVVVMLFTQAATGAEALLAWNGIVAARGLSEISVRGPDLAGARVKTAGTPRVEYAVTPQLEPNGRITIPVSTSAPGEVTLRIEFANGESVELPAGEMRRAAPPVIAVGDLAGAGLSRYPGVLVTAAADLPRLAGSYAHISAIALGPHALGRLDASQLRALQEHLGNCGRVLFVGVQSNTYRLALQDAGCGGRFLQHTSNVADAGIALDMLLAEQPHALPEERALQALLAKHGDLRLMTLFLSGTLLICFLLNAGARTRLLAPVFGIAAAALAGLLWTGGGRSSFVAWAEVAGDDEVARYSALDLLISDGRGEMTLRPVGLAQTAIAIEGDGTSLYWSAKADERRLRWSTSLLRQVHLYSLGSFPLESGLRAVNVDDDVTVCNNGKRPSPPAYAHWRGRSWALPELEPGMQWSSAGTLPTTKVTPALQLLQQRAPVAGPAVLQPLTVPGNGRQAWLMRAESSVAGLPPCRV